MSLRSAGDCQCVKLAVKGDRIDARWFPLEAGSPVYPGRHCWSVELRYCWHAGKSAGHAEHRGELAAVWPVGSDGMDQLQTFDSERAEGEGGPHRLLGLLVHQLHSCGALCACVGGEV